MLIQDSSSLPSNARLVKATIVSLLVASVLLVTTILPAEYGIDPTGIGKRLGLTVLASTSASPVAAPPEPSPTSSKNGTSRNEAEAAKAAAAFGTSPQQSFSAESLSPAPGDASAKHETLTVELAPGKGVEVKTLLKSGHGLVYHWSADGDVAVDMHGERTGVTGAWTSYAVEAAQRMASGTFTAPFDGSHGWYWENRGTTPVTVTIDVTGFQESLYQP